jgi:hypothetical protein
MRTSQSLPSLLVAVVALSLVTAVGGGGCSGKTPSTPPGGDGGPGNAPPDGGPGNDGPPDGGPGDGGPIVEARCDPSKSPDGCSFCDPAVWGGTVPTTATTAVTLRGLVLMDCAAEVKSLEIPAGAELRASRTQDSRLTLNGNLVVRGKLDYGTPADRVTASAEIVFQGMDDEKFVGTPNQGPDGNTSGPPQTVPMTVVSSDYGLWVMGSGTVTAAGRLKSAWSKLTEPAGPGDAAFTVMDATGWEPGDRIVLTPSAKTASQKPHYLQFDEAVIDTVEASQGRVTLQAAPQYEHAGCAGCVRRAEAINTSRNVVIRSKDTQAHAHILVAEQGRLQLDSVELRYLGPSKKCSGGAPERRAPIYFHQQGRASVGSFVRHVTIWGSKNQFLAQEVSHGVEVLDVAGYDTVGNGFSMFYSAYGCGTRCQGAGYAPEDTVFRHVLAAKVAVPERVSGCVAIGAVSGIIPSGGERSGCEDCVAVGSAYNYGAFGNEGAILMAESGSGRPSAFTFKQVVAHNNAGHGISNWQNAGQTLPPAYEQIHAWSNGVNGVHHGAYGNGFQYKDLTALDNGEADFAVIAIQNVENRPRVEDAVFDGFQTLPYFLVPERPVIIKNARFTGVRNPAITQVQAPCSGGDEDDPVDSVCIRNWLRFDNPQVPQGVQPFLFANHQNKHSVWEVRNFRHPDYPDLPLHFNLYRRDNQVAGGYLHAVFDAWLVPVTP